MEPARLPAPGALALIEDFCNSARFLRGEDDLATLPDARAWLRTRGRRGAARALDDEGLADLLGLREAIRSHLGGDASAAARATLNAHAGVTLGSPRWTTSGRPQLPPAGASEVGDFVGGLLAALAVEELAGRRERLKVCQAPECGWVFYDRSPGNNGVWCSMSVCGARHKMRAYRDRCADAAGRVRG
ncbi:CGNR zinc finger domain-containing protein [Actinopolymorpha pittospori]|uniref:RNA-binding Zn ribbon-like protein n=1 Tax=Actinopolymorpha pittospori TaxID=648752 RepID=A0A927RFX8_9ACTN|nr:putative RNA-binding Zn ribbon-like protein [Actinopolymorpha pittospori]